MKQSKHTKRRRTAVRLTLIVALAMLAHSGAGCASEVVVQGAGAGGQTASSPTVGVVATATSTTGGGGSATACRLHAECRLLPRTCCGDCGQPSATDMEAVHVDDVQQQRDAACGDDAACPPCASPGDPNLFAYCAIADGASEGTCQAVDVRTHALSACEFDGDCRLRIGAECCEGCIDETQIVALNRFENDLLGDMRCDDEPGIGCPECAPQIPPQFSAICSGGHCAVGTLDD